jgi:hypothetical protein
MTVARSLANCDILTDQILRNTELTINRPLLHLKHTAPVQTNNKEDQEKALVSMIVESCRFKQPETRRS